MKKCKRISILTQYQFNTNTTIELDSSRPHLRPPKNKIKRASNDEPVKFLENIDTFFFFTE